MSAYNMVRMRVKAGHEKEFLELNERANHAMAESMKKNGFKHGAIVKTGERSYCFVAEWENMDALARSRSEMIKNLDRMRHILEDLGNGLGVTDPVSGEAVLEMH